MGAPHESPKPATADLNWLLDRARIKEVLVAYCQGVDRREWDQVIACYHEDAIDTHGTFTGRPQELAAKMRKDHEHVSLCMHALSNVAIRFYEDEGRFAHVESYCLSRKLVDSAEHDPYLRDTGAVGPVWRTVACRYVDTFEHRPGYGWRILERTVVHEWMRTDADESFIPFGVSVARSRRDRSDLLFSADRSAAGVPRGALNQ